MLATSKQSYYFAVVGHVDTLGGRGFRKPRHRHNLTRKHNDKACSGTDFYVFDVDGEMLGAPKSDASSEKLY